MKVTKSEDNLLEFDTGISIIGDGDVDCCAINYLDFTQLPVGTELPDMSVGELVDAINLKDDGFYLKDRDAVPKWVQARSDQNGYYSNMTTLHIKGGGLDVQVGDLYGKEQE